MSDVLSCLWHLQLAALPFTLVWFWNGIQPAVKIIHKKMMWVYTPHLTCGIYRRHGQYQSPRSERLPYSTLRIFVIISNALSLALLWHSTSFVINVSRCNASRLRRLTYLLQSTSVYLPLANRSILRRSLFVPNCLDHCFF